MGEMSQMKRVLDNITGTSIFVVAQDSHRILYVNERIKKVKPSIQVGDICEEVWNCDHKNCPACSMGDNKNGYMTSYDVPFGKFVDMSAIKIMWEEKTPAYLVSVSGHTFHEVDQERELGRAQMQIAVSQIYTMVISVNLTKNTYFMVEYADFDSHCAPGSGNFDELVEVGATSIHPDYREAFLKNFNRESLLDFYGTGEVSRYMEHLQMGDDGAYHWTDTHVIRIQNPYSQDVIQISLSRNIDKRKRMQMRTQEALAMAKRANQAKSDFISRMSHDLRTPINAIMGMSEIASSNLQNPGKVKECLSKIRVSTRFLLSMVSDILDMSIIEGGRLALTEKEFNFRSMVQGIAAILALEAEQKKLNLHFSIEGRVSETFIGDELRLNQILLNLLSNAIQYTGEGGEVSLEASQSEVKDGKASLALKVKDNGVGMSEEFQKVLFEPFEQESSTEGRVFEGSGLGLSITRNLVELMGGTIQFESRQGEGTTFFVELPFLVPNALEGMEEEESDVLEGFQGEHVLVVEDNEINLEIVQTFLESWNLDVDAAENGQVALEKFKDFQPGWYRLVLMDIRMPVMDGLTATRQIRRLNREDAGTIPIMALTANASPEDIRSAQGVGLDAYLTKPIEMKFLHRKIKEFMY